MERSHPTSVDGPVDRSINHEIVGKLINHPKSVDRKLVIDSKVEITPLTTTQTAKSEYLIGMKLQKLGLKSMNSVVVQRTMGEAYCYNTV